mmetsp:Transcript_22167/g.31675  ORF Transcript_22167/g.31675 Transcript_22167/m.31675 type:complete len:220 (-) Transcript_22167:45-704(-)
MGITFSWLRGGIGIGNRNNQLKKSLQASEDKVTSLKEEIGQLNKQLKTLEGKHEKESSVRAEEAKILEEKNSEFIAKIEDLTSRNSELEAANEVFIKEKEQSESNKEILSQSKSAQKISELCATAIAATSDKEIQNVIKMLERKNEELRVALTNEKKKALRRKQEASDRRAKFKERVQNLTRKLPDDEDEDELPSEDSDDAEAEKTPKAGSSPKRVDFK